MSQSQYPYKTDNPIVNHWNYLNGTMGRWDAGRFLRTTGTVPFVRNLSANFNTSAPLKFGGYKFYL